MTPRDARDAALEALLQMERRGAWSDGSLKRIAAQSGLEARDTALCTRMTYGVVQNRTLLDYYIDHWCTQKAARLEPVVACLLRLGIYQILFMEKVPDRAAVHETVELTKRRGKARAAGMINAVLRKCASSKILYRHCRRMVCFQSSGAVQPSQVVGGALDGFGRRAGGRGVPAVG